jgi:hypothetical protein
VLIATCGIVLACDTGSEGPTGYSPTGPSTPQRTFVLSGVVRDERGFPLPDATVELTQVGRAGRYTITGEDGIFAFEGVAGLLGLWARKIGHEPYQQSLVVNADREIGVFLPKLAAIILGQTIRASTHEPPCDPVQWDAFAPCRRFHFTPASTGVLVIVVSWNNGRDLDATIVLPNNMYLGTSELTGNNEITVKANVEAGEEYEIRVNSYYARQTFELKADLLTAGAP